MLNKSLFFLVLSLSAVPVVNAATISFSSGTFASSSVIESGTTIPAPTAVTGLQQFDPSLGILTGVSFSFLAGTFEYQTQLFGETTDGVDFDAEYSAFIQADLAYISGLSGLVQAGLAEGIDSFCSGTGTGHTDDCIDIIDANVELVDGFEIPWLLSNFNLVDLVGLGDVANLELSINIFDDTLSSSGLSFVDVSGGADITGAIIEVTYDYSVVPVPAAVWLFGSGLLGLVGIARRRKY